MNAVVKTAAVPFLKKITPKTVSESIGIDLMALQRPVEARILYDLFGYVIGAVQGQTDKGPWVKFKGRFQAVTPADKDGVVHVFDSGAAHIPVLEDILHGAVETLNLAAKETGTRGRIEIALRIGIKPAPAGKPSATGYEYDVQRLIPEKVEADDPIALLRRASAEANPPQLAAPVVDAKEKGKVKASVPAQVN